MEKSWQMTANYIVIAIAGIAGVTRFSAWSVFLAALLLSLMRARFLESRANEVADEWRKDDQRPALGAAQLLTLAAGFCGHLLFCAVAFLVGAGLSRLVW